MPLPPPPWIVNFGDIYLNPPRVCAPKTPPKRNRPFGTWTFEVYRYFGIFPPVTASNGGCWVLLFKCSVVVWGRLLVVMSGSPKVAAYGRGRSEGAMDERNSVSLDVFGNQSTSCFFHKKSRKFMIYINLVDDEVYFRSWKLSAPCSVYIREPTTMMVSQSQFISFFHWALTAPKSPDDSYSN